MIEEAQFVQSRTGAANLMDQAGYIYYRKQQTSKTIQWRCREKKKHLCTGSAATQGFYISHLGGVHNHPPPTAEEIYLGYPTWQKKKKKSE